MPDYWEISAEEYEAFLHDMEEYNKYLARVALGMEDEHGN